MCNYVSNEGTQFDNKDYGSSVQCNYVLNVGTYSLTPRIMKVLCNYVPYVGANSSRVRIMKVVGRTVMF